MSEHEIFDPFFDYQVKWMYAGIEATMTNKESYHTCAMALSTYTEIMGGLVTGNLRKRGKSQTNYEAFLPYLGQKYVDLDNLIKTQYPDRLKNIYSAVRSKLVHEFSLREQHIILKQEKPNDDQIGIQLFSYKIENDEAIQLNFLLSEYYRDFKTGIIKYYNELKDCRKNGAIFDDSILGRFFKSTVAIHYSKKPQDNLDNSG